MNARWRRVCTRVAALLAIIALCIIPGLARAAGALSAVTSSASALVVPELPSGFEHRELGWLHLDAPKGISEPVEPLIEQANAVKEELSARFGQRVLDDVTVRVARTPEEMARLAPAGAPPPKYAVGVAYRGLHLVVLTLQPPAHSAAADLGEVFRHELAHVALDDAVKGAHVPRWFHEGVAVEASGEHPFDRLRTLWSATLSGELVPLQDLDATFPDDHVAVGVAYAESADFVRSLLRSADRPRFARLIERVRDGQPFEAAAADAYGASLRKLEFQWRNGLEKRYGYAPMLTGGSLLWGAAVAMLVAAYVKRRRRARAVLARWEREEAEEDARRAAQAKTADADATGDDPAQPLPAVAWPMVQHDGRWHSLH